MRHCKGERDKDVVKSYVRYFYHEVSTAEVAQCGASRILALTDRDRFRAGKTSVFFFLGGGVVFYFIFQLW